jgi:proline iminopeptidase
VLYTPIEPFSSGRLSVDAVHTLYFEQCGNPSGLPAIALHGGPGGGATPEMRRFFHPHRWRTVLFDQRGCGRSAPHASLDRNTTWDLVADIERLRKHLAIDKWVVFGGSWGSTLALAYAVSHPERIAALVLRGIFLLRREEIEWFYQRGASHLYPDLFEGFQSHIPEDERSDMVAAYHRRLTSPDYHVRIAAARAWARWEGSTITMAGPSALAGRFNEDPFVEAFARIECHYFQNRGFLPEDSWLLKQAGARLSRIPTAIVHGRFDLCTTLSNAWDLKKAMPQATLEIIQDAGHSSIEAGIADALVRATDRFVHDAAW